MARKDELLAELRANVPTVDPDTVERRLKDADPNLVVIDVREPEEYSQGYIPGAKYIPRTYMEMRLEDQVKDKNTDVVLYCASGTRSLFAAKAVQDLGYANVYNMSGGFNAWKNAGKEWTLNKYESLIRSARYSRHLLIPEVGEDGQQKLLESRVLLIGAGGLGSPAIQYLAAAGVGTLGVIDADVVDESNLQRQIIHKTSDIGRPKVDSARDFVKNLNPDVEVVQYRERLDSDNAYRIFDDGWDLIINGCDNFPTRYLMNDAAYFRGIPVVDGSIYRFEGQVTVYKFDEGPCYRCLYPEPPPPELAPSCAEAGVLGVLPGVVGTLQAVEAIKVLLNIGTPLVGSLMVFDALDMRFRHLHVQKDPQCPLCGPNPTVTDLIDYEWFCSANLPAAAEGEPA